MTEFLSYCFESSRLTLNPENKKFFDQNKRSLRERNGKQFRYKFKFEMDDGDKTCKAKKCSNTAKM